MSASKLKSQLTKELKKRKGNGIAQNEIELLYGYSRSYISETLNKMESDSEIIRKTEGKLIKRVWLREYYPGVVERYLRIGFLKSTEYIPLLKATSIVAEVNGIELNLKLYDDAVEMMKDLEQKTLDLALSPIFTQILFSLTSKGVFIVGTVATGGSAILENEKSTNDLCASSESSSMILLMRQHFGNGKYEIKTIKNPVKASSEFLSNKYRYMAIWEPYVTSLERNKSIREVANYDEVLGELPCCGISTNEALFRKVSPLLTSIMSKYRELAKKNALPGDLEELIVKLARAYKTSKSDIEESLSKYDFLPKYSLEMVEEYLEYLGLTISHDTINRIFKFI